MKKYTFTILFSILALFFLFLYFSSYDNNGILLIIPNKINDFFYGFDTANSLIWNKDMSLKTIFFIIIFFFSYFLIGLAIDSLIEWFKSRRR